MKKLLFAFLFSIISIEASAANITASVNRNKVPLGEVFVLTITSDENTNDTPDLSVLSNDFKTYSTSVSRSSYVVNGKASNSTKWQVTMSALKEGLQNIPPIKVGSDFSNEIEVDILPYGEKSNDKTTSQTPEYSINAEIANKHNKFYVQQQIPYNVTITDVGGLQGGEPVFDPTNDFIIKSLGQPDVSSVYKNGKNVREITFKFVLFALKSGKIKIPSVKFNGYTISSNGAGIFTDSIFNLNIGFPSRLGFEVPVNLYAPEKEVNIMPAPSDYNGKWWLPADSVEIRANFTDNNKQFMVGEAFSREITVTAVGVIDTQLPQPDFALSSDFKQYPQKSTAVNEVIENMPVAVQKTINVYIPERSGELTLPEVNVEWFDVNSQTLKTAKLPPQTIRVKENPNLKMVVEDNLTANQEMKVEKNIIKENLSLNQLVFLLIVAFAVGLLVSYFIFKPRKLKAPKPQCETRAYPDFIIKKAYANDFRGLRDGLISWATGFYPDKQINTLKDVADAVNNKEFSEQINIIIAKLYNPQNDCIFNAKIFADSYNNVSKKINKKQKNSTPLPTLYE